MYLKDLADVHTRRHTQGVQNDINGGAVFKIGHVLHGHDPGNNTLVAVAPSHLVTYFQFSLHGHIHPDHLDDAWRQVVPLFETLYLPLEVFLDPVYFGFIPVEYIVDKWVCRTPALKDEIPQSVKRYLFKGLFCNLRVCIKEQPVSCILDDYCRFFAYKVLLEFFQSGAPNDVDLVLLILHYGSYLEIFDLLCPFVFGNALPGKDPGIYHNTLNTRRHLEGGILHVAGLFAEDCPQEFFLW